MTPSDKRHCHPTLNNWEHSVRGWSHGGWDIWMQDVDLVGNRHGSFSSLQKTNESTGRGSHLFSWSCQRNPRWQSHKQMVAVWRGHWKDTERLEPTSAWERFEWLWSESLCHHLWKLFCSVPATLTQSLPSLSLSYPLTLFRSIFLSLSLPLVGQAWSKNETNTKSVAGTEENWQRLRSRPRRSEDGATLPSTYKSMALDYSPLLCLSCRPMATSSRGALSLYLNRGLLFLRLLLGWRSSPSAEFHQPGEQRDKWLLPSSIPFRPSQGKNLLCSRRPLSVSLSAQVRTNGRTGGWSKTTYTCERRRTCTRRERSLAEEGSKQGSKHAICSQQKSKPAFHAIVLLTGTDEEQFHLLVEERVAKAASFPQFLNPRPSLSTHVQYVYTTHTRSLFHSLFLQLIRVINLLLEGWQSDLPPAEVESRSHWTYPYT